MSMTHYHLAGVTTPSGQLNQIQEQDLDPQTQEMVEAYDGQVDPTFAAVLQQKPMKRLTSTAIATALTYVGIGGLAYTSGGAPVDFYYQPAAFGGTRDTTNCVKLSSPQGMLVLDSIDAQEGQPASASLMAYTTSVDGTTPPMTLTNAVTLPAPVMTRANYVLGPAKINNTLVSGVIGTSVRFGLQIMHECESGGAYPTYVYIMSRRAVATIRTRNVDLVASLGLFAAQSGTNKSTIYLRKVLAGGTRVPDATAQHISLGISSGMILTRRVPASQGQPAAVDLEIPITFDGTNAPLIVNTATAIT